MEIHECLLDFLYNVKHSSIEIEELSPLCFLKHMKNEIFFVCITHACVLTDTLAVQMAWYASYKKLSVLVKALPKLVL